MNKTVNFSREPLSLLRDIIAKWVLVAPQRTIFSVLNRDLDEERSLTYEQLYAQALRIGTVLKEHGVKQGDRAVLVYRNRLDFVEAFLACIFFGVIAVPVKLPGASNGLMRLVNILQDADPACILTHQDTCQVLRERIESCDASVQTIWIATHPLSGSLPLRERDAALSLDDLAILQYTSGSTGTPKGVSTSHRNLSANQHMICDAFESGDDDSLVSWLPFFHDMGLAGSIVQSLCVGHHARFLPTISFLKRPVRWLQAISRYKATLSGGPNFVYDLCVDSIREDEKAGLDLSSWRLAFNGAEPVNYATLERFYRAFRDYGFAFDAFYPTYGMAEATLIVSGDNPRRAPRALSVSAKALQSRQLVVKHLPDDDTRILTSCGEPVAGQHLAIVDPERCTPCQDGEVGEIWIAGPHVATGYWKRTERDNKPFQATLPHSREQYFRTGDLGFKYQQELYITGRIKDLMIFRGKNHYPQDIERSVFSATDALRVGGCAAFSIMNQEQEVLVIIAEIRRRKLRTLSQENVVTRITRTVSREHALDIHDLVLLKSGAIPKTTSGKVRRSLCKTMYLADEFERLRTGGIHA